MSVYLLVGVTTFLVILRPGLFSECGDNKPCPENQHCEASRCIDCFDCNWLNRNSNFSCAYNQNECGNCKKGFEEVSLTVSLGNYKKPCRAVGTVLEGHGRKCSTNNDCGEQHFCYEERLCIRCLDCAKYSRQASPTAPCAKEVQDCGICLPGYTDVPVTDGSRSKPCQGQSAPLQSQKTEVNVNVGALSLIGGVIVVALAILCALLAYRTRKINIKPRQYVTESPPPYPEGGVVEVLEEETAEQVCGYYKETMEADSTARVFRLPDYATRNASASRQQAEPMLVEDAVPCNWQHCHDEQELNPEGNALNTVGHQIPTSITNEEISEFEEDASKEPASKRLKSN